MIFEQKDNSDPENCILEKCRHPLRLLISLPAGGSSANLLDRKRNETESEPEDGTKISTGQ